MDVATYLKEWVRCHIHAFRWEARRGRNSGNPDMMQVVRRRGASGKQHDLGRGTGVKEAVGLGRLGQR